MLDICSPKCSDWQVIEMIASDIFENYGYEEIRTPIVEHAELFHRSVGEKSSVVQKEMYSFTDQGNDHLCLRPEGTAPVVRAYIESGACNTQSQSKYFYMGPMFRRERPQKGRQRQFHQIGCELFDAKTPQADAEVIEMANYFLNELGIFDVSLEINSIGCAACRPGYYDELIAFFKDKANDLCDNCKRRLADNPLRILDCKNSTCQAMIIDAPLFSKSWCDECTDHFQTVRDELDQLNIAYTVNERIVRGLDYYVRTAFEFLTNKLGAQNAVLAGGRYDGLVAELGGPDISGIGFAMGVERLLLLLGDKEPVDNGVIYVACLGELATKQALPIISGLRHEGLHVQWSYGQGSMKSQMRRANRLNAMAVIILGEDELKNDNVIIKWMDSSEQEICCIRDLNDIFLGYFFDGDMDVISEDILNQLVVDDKEIQ